jgi:hypothetical protein
MRKRFESRSTVLVAHACFPKFGVWEGIEADAVRLEDRQSSVLHDSEQTNSAHPNATEHGRSVARALQGEVEEKR